MTRPTLSSRNSRWHGVKAKVTCSNGGMVWHGALAAVVVEVAAAAAAKADSMCVAMLHLPARNHPQKVGQRRRVQVDVIVCRDLRGIVGLYFTDQVIFELGM